MLNYFEKFGSGSSSGQILILKKDPVPDPAGSWFEKKIRIRFRPDPNFKKRSGSGSGRILNCGSGTSLVKTLLTKYSMFENSRTQKNHEFYLVLWRSKTPSNWTSLTWNYTKNLCRLVLVMYRIHNLGSGPYRIRIFFFKLGSGRNRIRIFFLN